jgi:flagellar biogenesis protein FliO
MWKTLLLACSLTASSSSSAEQSLIEPEPAALEAPVASLPLAQSPSTGSMALLWAPVVLFGAAALVLRRHKRSGAAGRMRIVDTLHIGKGRSILIVDVRGREVLVAATEGGVSLLETPLPAAPPAPEAPADLLGSRPRISVTAHDEAAFERHLDKQAPRCVEDEELSKKIARLQDAFAVTDGKAPRARAGGR